jgi:hypothetical protein
MLQLAVDALVWASLTAIQDRWALTCAWPESVGTVSAPQPAHRALSGLEAGLTALGFGNYEYGIALAAATFASPAGSVAALAGYTDQHRGERHSTRSESHPEIPAQAYVTAPS